MDSSRSLVVQFEIPFDFKSLTLRLKKKSENTKSKTWFNFLNIFWNILKFFSTQNEKIGRSFDSKLYYWLLMNSLARMNIQSIFQCFFSDFISFFGRFLLRLLSLYIWPQQPPFHVDLVPNFPIGWFFHLPPLSCLAQLHLNFTGALTITIIVAIFIADYGGALTSADSKNGHQSDRDAKGNLNSTYDKVTNESK